MFKKFKQRIEEGEQQPGKILSSTPKKNNVNSSKPRRILTKSPITAATTTHQNGSSSRNSTPKISSMHEKGMGSRINSQSITNPRPSKAPNFNQSQSIGSNINGLSNDSGFSTTTSSQRTTTRSKGENKWEKRRRSSFASSRESLVSVDSGATTGTAAFSRISYGGGSSSVEDAPYYDHTVISDGLRDSATREEILTELTNKNEKIRALQNKVNELTSAYAEQGKQRDRLEEALENIRNEMLSRSQSSNNESFRCMQEEYEQKLVIKDQQIKEYKNKHQESLHSAAELVAKSMKVENLEKEYKDQKREFENLERTLNDLSSDRTKYEMQIKQLSTQLSISEKDKAVLVEEINQKSNMLETLQFSLDKAHDETRSTQHTYNSFKTKAMTEIDERDSEIMMWKNKIHDLQQKVDGRQFSDNDQIKSLEKENRVLSKSLQEAREQVSSVRAESSKQIEHLQSLVASLEQSTSKKDSECESSLMDTLRSKVSSKNLLNTTQTYSEVNNSTMNSVGVQIRSPPPTLDPNISGYFLTFDFPTFPDTPVPDISQHFPTFPDISQHSPTFPTAPDISGCLGKCRGPVWGGPQIQVWMTYSW